MQQQLIFSFVRACQIFAGRSCERYRRARLEQALSRLADCVPPVATQCEYLCVVQVLENVCLGLARHVHTSFHREYGGCVTDCDFDPVTVAGEMWIAQRSTPPHGAFLTTAKKYLDSFEAAHPIPAPVKAAELIRRHAVEGISASMIARQVGCHRLRLRTLFKTQYGKTPRQYLMQCRLRRAVRLLRRTHLSVFDIAERAGFGSRDYFYRAFLHEFGVTPGQYRRQEGKTHGDRVSTATRALSLVRGKDPHTDTHVVRMD